MRFGFVLATAALSLLAASCGHSVERDAHADQGPGAVKVKVATPITTQLEETSDYTGRAEAVDDVEIRPRASGHIQQVAFHEGELVKKGDLLFVIDPRPAQAAIARAHAEISQIHADHGLAERDTDRAEKLFKSASISARELDVQKSSLESLKARGESASAALQTAQLDLEYCYVRAPVSGRIGRIVVTPGNFVGPTTAQPLATVVSVNPLHVYVDVDETRALGLGRALLDPAGARGGVAHVGFADEAAYPHDAKIDFLDNRVDARTGTQKVRVVVDNSDGKLTPGLFARVRLDEGASHPAILVDDRAVGTDQDRRFVWVVDGENKVQYRAVKLGPIHDGLRVVREGVAANDQVVVAGLQRVRGGAAVTPEKVAMGASTGEKP